MYRGSGKEGNASTAWGFGCRARWTIDRFGLTSGSSDEIRPVYVSATPGDYELEQTHGEVVEQLIRRCGLLDPEIEIKPV